MSRATSVRLERVALPEVPWDVLDAQPDRLVTQTRAWLDFLADARGVEPVAARVVHAGDTVGWFTGAIERRGGLRFLGSPLRGWTTAAMGFELAPDAGIDRLAAIGALPSFAFRDLGCVHLEVADRQLTEVGIVPAGFLAMELPGYELDLRPSPDELLAGMRPNGRRDVRRALRNGIEVEVVDPAAPGDFVATYYAQVAEAFAKRGLRPTYPRSRVEAMVRHLGPTGNLLLLRARTADGRDAATGIFPGLAGSTAEYWMGASERDQQKHLPNEALMWSAITTWRERGAVRLNFGGGGRYKAKYGGADHVLPWFRRSLVPGAERARRAALALHRRTRRLPGAR